MRNVVGSGCDYWSLSQRDCWVIQNEYDIVVLLFNMCKVKIVLKDSNDANKNRINRSEIQGSIQNSNAFLSDSSNIPLQLLLVTNLVAELLSCNGG